MNVGNIYSIVVFDTETNGLDTRTADLLSIGWIKVNFDTRAHNFKVVDHVEYYVHDLNVHNTKESYGINKISDEYRNEHGLPVNEIMKIFKSVINNAHVFAYNIEYDYKIVVKYDRTLFENVLGVDEIMIHDGEPVINCLQRIVFHYRQAFDKFVYTKNHLHSAFDDVSVELIILLFDKFNANVESLLINVDEYIPEITVGKFKHKRIDSLIKYNMPYIKWFLFSKDSEFEDYLRYYIMNTCEVKLSKAELNKFGGKLNSFFWNISKQSTDFIVE